jgi:hypothetical protein
VAQAFSGKRFSFSRDRLFGQILELHFIEFYKSEGGSKETVQNPALLFVGIREETNSVFLVKPN